MESTRNQLLNLFERFADQDGRLIDEINGLAEQRGEIVYSLIAQILANLDLSPEEAVTHWHHIVANRNDLGSAIGREISLRTAVCDYFCSINKSLHNPKIIEISLFEKATRSSTFDSLTGLLNRSTFDESLKREISRARRYDTNLSLLFLDIDNFKQINDTQGHIAGDEVLKNVARIIMAEKRSEDIASRYGGEELTVLLPETGKAEAWMIGERIRKAVEEPVLHYEGKSISVTLSGGLASFPIDAVDDLTLVDNADRAMYRAKGLGKNNIVLYSMDKRRNVRVEYNTEVAIQELGIHEKPVLSATTKSLSIGGALLESRHPFEVGTKIQVHISLDGQNPLIIIGTVIRSQKISVDSYEISVAFLDANRALKNEISSYLIKHIGEVPSRTVPAAQLLQ